MQNSQQNTNATELANIQDINMNSDQRDAEESQERSVDQQNNNGNDDAEDVNDDDSKYYKEKMLEHKKNSLEIFHEIHSSILYVNEFQSLSQFQLRIKYESINKQVLILQAIWGRISLNLMVLNIQGQNLKHNRYINSGAFGSIYNGYFNDQDFVIKCISAESPKERIKVIKECFLTKICSQLKVGPKMKSYFGFDLLVYSQCVQIAMEFCQPVSQKNFKKSELYENLATMHNINLVHQDIKPENIMYSPSNKRLVFIDFGLSIFIKEEIGNKTSTQFVGSVNFCCPDMKKAYISKKPNKVDLYYNDLFCLEKCVSTLNSMLQINKNRQQMYEFCNSEDTIEPFTYLSEIILKYYLFVSQQQKALNYYKQNILHLDSKDYYVTSILYFMEEIAPSICLQKFLKLIVTQTHKDTEIYCKIKTLHQICQNTLCNLQIFRRQDKYQYFYSLYQNALENPKNTQKGKKKEVQQWLLQDNIHTKITYMEYLNQYLKYISCTYNRYQVGDSDRYAVAKSYCSKFIDSKISQQLDGKQYIQKSVLHALQMCLKQKKCRQNIVILQMFRIFDIIAILDIGTSEMFMEWIQAIFSHRSMNQRYQFIFLGRVELSNSFNIFRIKPKADICRVDFSNKINVWIGQKNKKNLKSSQHQSLTYFQSISPEFFQEFFRQTSLFLKHYSHNYRCFDSTKVLLDLFYILKSYDQQQKMYMFLPLLFSNAYFMRNKNNLFRSIISLIKHTVGQNVLKEQFNFDFLTNTAFKFICPYQKKGLITIEELQKINSYIQQIEINEMLTMSLFMLNLCNEAIQLEKMKRCKIDSCYKSNGFIYKTFEMLKLQIRKIHQSQQLHSKNGTSNITKLFLFNSLFTVSRQKEILELIQKLKCQKCSQALNNSLKISQIQIYLLQYFDDLPSENPKKQILKMFFQSYQSFISSFKNKQSLTDDEKSQLEHGLRLGQIFCWQSDEIERKYHGIQNYYNFVIVKNNKIQYYFNHYQLRAGIFSILKLLNKTDEQKYIDFLFRVAKLFENTLMLRSYGMFLTAFQQLLQKQDKQKIFQLFDKLRKSEKQRQQKYSYIAMIYGIILSLVNPQNSSKIVKGIKEHFDSINYMFKRDLIIRIHSQFYKQQKISRRRWLYCNNRLLKWLMIYQKTVRNTRKLKWKNSMMKKIMKRIRKYEKFQMTRPTIRFRIR